MSRNKKINSTCYLHISIFFYPLILFFTWSVENWVIWLICPHSFVRAGSLCQTTCTRLRWTTRHNNYYNNVIIFYHQNVFPVRTYSYFQMVLQLEYSNMIQINILFPFPLIPILETSRNRLCKLHNPTLPSKATVLRFIF